MRARGQAGFTLIELMVSLAILSMVAGMLAAGVQLVRQMAVRATQQSISNETIVTAQAILRDRIESLVPSARFDQEKPTVDLRGAGTILSFFAPALPAERPTTIRRYRLLRTAAGQIVLYQSPDLSSRVDAHAPGEVGWAPTILLTGVGDLRIDYYGAAAPDGDRRWRAQWIDQALPPELIRIRLAFDQGDKRQWPDLIVRPFATVNSACRLDAFTGRCSGT